MANSKPKKIFELFRASDGRLKIIEDDEEFRSGTVKKMGANNYLVFRALVSFMNKDNTCYPSISTLCDMLGFSANTISKALKELEEMGYIKKEQIKLPKVKAKHNQYTIIAPVEDTTEDEESGNDIERLFAHFKNKFRERYHVEYKSEYGVESDLRDLEKIYNECNQDFDYACKVIDNHIDSYVGTKKYETPNIYFLLQYRLVEMKKKVGKELKQQERNNNPQKPRDRYAYFVEDDANKIEPIDPNELNEFLSEQSEKKRKIANF